MTSKLPTILCVDDDPGILDLLTEFLTSQGYDVLTAANGVEAFLQVKQWKPQLVIMDLFMPQLGGLGALGRMKALQPDIAVILMSGMSTALDLVGESGLMVTAALSKPLDLALLLEALALAGVPAPASLAASAVAKQQPPVRARVLVTDDEIGMRKMMAEYRPHIVLLDLLMAGIGGLETLRRIKAMMPEIHVIVVTAVEQLESAQEALQIGADDYVTKPFTLRELDTVLESHTLMSRSASASQ
jgi:CheY-like chemotaxis protein